MTDDDGATADTTMALKKLEPACTGRVMVERVVATSPCLRRYEIENGQQYRSEYPVSLNGVTITPAEGKYVLINVLGAGLLRRFEVIAGDAVATFPFKGQHLKLQSGPLRWTYEDHELRNVGRLDGQKLNGLRDERRAAVARAAVARRRAHVRVREAAGRVRRADQRQADRAHRRCAGRRCGERRRRVLLRGAERVDRPDRAQHAEGQL